MKKKIISIIIVILLILVGVGVFLYLKTDMFKSNQQLFWNYAIKNSEVTELFNNDSVKEIKNKKINNSYKINSKLDINTEDGEYLINSNTNSKNLNDIFTQVEFTKDSENIVDFNLVNKNNVVGLKMDELANGYITLKNSDLKSLAEKIGLENTNSFPDNINWGTYVDILEIQQDDVDYISNKYMKLIINDTNKKNYEKSGSAGIKINDKIHTATTYKMTITENESKKILSDVFNELSKDSRTLNIISSKLKMLNLPSEYTQINYLSEKFTKIKSNIDSLETTDDELLEITVYAEKSELIQTDIKVKDERIIKIVYDKENNKINLKQELLNDNITNKFVLSISDVLNKIVSNVDEMIIDNHVSEDKNTMTTKVNVICKKNITISYISTTEITDNISTSNDYEQSKKIILNDLTKEQLQKLYNAIINNIKGIYQDKKALISNN